MATKAIRESYETVSLRVNSSAGLGRASRYLMRLSKARRPEGLSLGARKESNPSSTTRITLDGVGVLAQVVVNARLVQFRSSTAINKREIRETSASRMRAAS